MSTRELCVAAWLVTGLLCGACGGDDDGGNAADSGSTNGGGGSGGDDSSGGDMDASSGSQTDGGGNTGSSGTGGGSTNDGGPSTSDEDGGSEACGAVVCEAPECCVDPFASLCGAQLGRACLMPPPEGEGSDPRCPSVNIMGIFSLPSCCTEENECGIDATMFGTGCITYAEAEEGANMMGAPPGAIPWPAAQSCD